MYRFKTNLMEMSGIIPRAWAALKRLASSISRKIGDGWKWNGSDKLHGPDGHHIEVSDGYYHLYKDGKHTGISDSDDEGMIAKIINFFRGKKKK